MINDNTILSSFDDRPTLLEWLKKVEDALKTDSATAVSVENPSANTYVFKITFADGKTLSSGNVVFPDSVKDVSIKNGHIIVTQISGTQTDLGVLNPYADTIVVNAETNTTEIGGKLQVSEEAQVTGNVSMGGNLGVTGQAVVGGGLSVNGALGVTGNATIGGRLQADSSIISNGEIRGGNISGTKFLLGTEEMPLVKANPTGEATQTLEKVKIGDVAYNVGGKPIIKDTISFVGQTDDFDIYNDSTGTKVRFTIPKTNELWGFFYKNIFIAQNGELTGTDYSKIISSCMLVEINDQRIRIPLSKQFGTTVVSHDSYFGSNDWYDSGANEIKKQEWYVHIPDNPELEQAWIKCNDTTLTDYGSYITKITFIEFNYE